MRFGPTTVAADLVEDDLATRLHAGVEHWLGAYAVRAGTYRDSNGTWQWTGGAGVRLGRVGFDVAVATHNRTVEEERSTELSASIALY